MSFSIKGLEIFAAGTWNGDTYTQADLNQIVQAFDKVGFTPPLKMGHTKDQKFLQKDGLPAAGWIDRVYINGGKLLADISRIPKKVYELLKKGAYRHVSSEIYWNLKRGDSVFPRALKAVALLGAETPAVSGLTPIDAMLAQYMKMFQECAEEIKAYAFETEHFTMDDETIEDISTPGESQMGVHLDSKDGKKKKDGDKDNKEGDKKMSDEAMKKLEKEMQSMKEAMEASSKKHETEVSEYKADLKVKDEKVTALGEALVAVQKDKAFSEIKAFTAELISSGKLAPSVKTDVETLLTTLSASEATVKQYNDKKEEVTSSVLDFAKKLFSAMPTLVEFKELSESASDRKEGTAQNQLDAKVSAYAEEHKVSYGDALVAILAANPGLTKEYMGQG